MKIIPQIYRRLPKRIRAKTNKLYKHLPGRKKLVTTIDGITYDLDLRTVVHAQIYYYGCWEPDTTKIINKVVKEGMTVFDIGASTGPHALRMAKLVGKGGKVYAFEPSTELFPDLVHMKALNGFTNIEAECIALSDKIEEKIYYTNTLFRLGDEEKKAEDRMTMFDTLDNYIEKHRIKNIDFVKIDVDGLETKIIKGGYKSIKKFKPIMIVEFSKGAQEHYGGSIKELKDTLESLGYHFYNVKNLLEYASILHSVPETGSINVLCLHGGGDATAKINS